MELPAATSSEEGAGLALEPSHAIFLLWVSGCVGCDRLATYELSLKSFGRRYAGDEALYMTRTGVSVFALSPSQ